MTLVENLLKLTDYPFSYSLVGVLFFIFFSESISSYVLRIEFLPILSIIGVFGTALVITDPFGRIVKKLGLRASKVSVPSFDQSGLNLFDNEDQMFLKHILELYSEYGYITDEFKRELRRRLLQVQNKKLDLEQEISDINELKAEAVGASVYDRIVDTRNNLSLLKKQEDFLIMLDFALTVDTTGSTAVRTQWINTEINKIVGIIYFAFIILILCTSFILKPSLFTNYFFNLFEPLNHQHHVIPLLIHSNFYMFEYTVYVDYVKLLSDYMVIENITQVLAIILYVVLIGLGAVLFHEIRLLQRKIRTVVVYMLIVERESSELTDYVQKINQHLSNNEWILAELWTKLAYKKL